LCGRRTKSIELAGETGNHIAHDVKIDKRIVVLGSSLLTKFKTIYTEHILSSSESWKRIIGSGLASFIVHQLQTSLYG